MVQDFQDQQEGRNGSSRDQVADSSVEPVDHNIEERRGARLCVGALTVVEMDGEDQTEDVEQIFRQEDVFDSPVIPVKHFDFRVRQLQCCPDY